MVSLSLDPIVLYCPQISHGEDSFNRYIDTLLVLFDLKNSSWAQLNLSAETSLSLLNSNRFPLGPEIKQSLDHFDRTDIQLRDIVSLGNWILSNLPSLEDKMQIKEILHDSCIIVPDSVISARPEPLQVCLTTLLSLMSLTRKIDPENNSKQYLVTRDFCDKTTTIEFVSSPSN